MVNLISGKQLKLLLKRRRISSIELCRVLNMSQAQVSRYFTNEVAMPATFIVKVAAYANLSLNDLTEGSIAEAQVIDITPPAPQVTIAAEPAPTYESKRPPDPAPVPSPLVQIDVSALDIIIHELRTKLTVMEHELGKIKQELELVHH
jgi:transcriptional regulator with XRE-family HTH domain